MKLTFKNLNHRIKQPRYNPFLPYESRSSGCEPWISSATLGSCINAHVWLTCVPRNGRRRHTCTRDTRLARDGGCVREWHAHTRPYAWGSRWRRTRHMPACFIPWFQSGHTLDSRFIQPWWSYEPLFSRRGNIPAAFYNGNKAATSLVLDRSLRNCQPFSRSALRSTADF